MTKEEAFKKYSDDLDEKLPALGESSVKALLFLAELLKFIRDEREKAFKAGFLAGRDEAP